MSISGTLTLSMDPYVSIFLGVVLKLSLVLTSAVDYHPNLWLQVSIRVRILSWQFKAHYNSINQFKVLVSNLTDVRNRMSKIKGDFMKV